jgi:HK97 family phage major capsid protein
MATASSRYLLYGDFSQLLICDRIGPTFEIIQNLVGAAFRPTGQRGALLWFRTGSAVLVPNAFRVLVKA